MSEREPMSQFLSRFRDFWTERAERATDEAVRDESEEAALELDDLIGQWGRAFK